MPLPVTRLSCGGSSMPPCEDAGLAPPALPPALLHTQAETGRRFRRLIDTTAHTRLRRARRLAAACIQPAGLMYQIKVIATHHRHTCLAIPPTCAALCCQGPLGWGAALGCLDAPACCQPPLAAGAPAQSWAAAAACCRWELLHGQTGPRRWAGQRPEVLPLVLPPLPQRLCRRPAVLLLALACPPPAAVPPCHCRCRCSRLFPALLGVLFVSAVICGDGVPCPLGALLIARSSWFLRCSTAQSPNFLCSLAAAPPWPVLSVAIMLAISGRCPIAAPFDRLNTATAS